MLGEQKYDRSSSAYRFNIHTDSSNRLVRGKDGVFEITEDYIMGRQRDIEESFLNGTAAMPSAQSRQQMVLERHKYNPSPQYFTPKNNLSKKAVWGK